MSKKVEVYSSRTVVWLVGAFSAFFWLLYLIGVQLHESNKVQDEIDKIRETNRQLKSEIEAKEARVAYLRTPQRIEKEAKIQMGKKLPGEKIIVFVEEELEMVPEEDTSISAKSITENMSTWEKWQWLFFGDRG